MVIVNRPEHDHEGMEEVFEVPAWHRAVDEAMLLQLVACAEQLHAHHGEDKHDDSEHKRQVTQSTCDETHVLVCDMPRRNRKGTFVSRASPSKRDKSRERDPLKNATERIKLTVRDSNC